MAPTRSAAARSALAVGLCACALGTALAGGGAPNGPFVTSINGLGVPVSEWPSSDESVSSMTLKLLTDVDPLVRRSTRMPCGFVSSGMAARNARSRCTCADARRRARSRLGFNRRRCATTVRAPRTAPGGGAPLLGATTRLCETP
jgi:hypothetical protein